MLTGTMRMLAEFRIAFAELLDGGADVGPLRLRQAVVGKPMRLGFCLLHTACSPSTMFSSAPITELIWSIAVVCSGMGSRKWRQRTPCQRPYIPGRRASAAWPVDAQEGERSPDGLARLKRADRQWLGAIVYCGHELLDLSLRRWGEVCQLVVSAFRSRERETHKRPSPPTRNSPLRTISSSFARRQGRFPWRHWPHRLPDRAFQRPGQLPGQFEHPLVSGVTEVAFLIDVEERQLAFRAV